MPISAKDPIKVRVKPNQSTVIITGGTGATVTAANVGIGTGVFKQKAINTLQFKSLSGGTNVDLVDGDTIVINSTVDTSNFLENSVFTGYTASTNTQLNNIENDITYLSGQTDLKLAISDFNIYSGNTASDLSTISADLTALSGDVATNTTSISDNAADIAYLSGETDSKLAISDFNTYSGNTKNDIDSKLNVSDFNTYSGNTKNDIDSKLNVSDFNTYSGNTENDIDYISGQTDLKADKNLEIVSLSTSTTLSESDNGKAIECDGTFTVTIPTGLSVGWQVLITNVGSGTITIAANGTLQSKDSLVDIASQFAGVTAYHRGSNNILVIGDLS